MMVAFVTWMISAVRFSPTVVFGTPLTSAAGEVLTASLETVDISGESFIVGSIRNAVDISGMIFIDGSDRNADVISGKVFID